MTHDPIFPKGIRANKNFTGAAYVNFLVPDTDATYDCQVYDVVFEPGCRNNWHSHGAGQLLLCTDGVGYYQEKGKSARCLVRGDVVEIPPSVIHWHGAAPDSAFTHIGISPNAHKGVEWLSPVTDEEYERATEAKQKDNLK